MTDFINDLLLLIRFMALIGVGTVVFLVVMVVTVRLLTVMLQWDLDRRARRGK